MKSFPWFASRSNFLFLTGCAVVFLAGTSAAMAVHTVTLTSSNFSLGFGFGETFSPSWVAVSPSTPTTQGNFKFSATPVDTLASYYSGTAPGFPGRVLTDNGGYNDNGSNFLATISASWLGGLPADTVSEVPPNFQIKLNITQISIYGTAYLVPGSLGFKETGGGSQTLQAMPTTTSFGGLAIATNYAKLAWDPADSFVAGTNATRSFTLAFTGDARPVDGFEVFGNVQLLYDIPEPSTVVLVLAGIGFIVIRRRTIH